MLESKHVSCKFLEQTSSVKNWTPSSQTALVYDPQITCIQTSKLTTSKFSSCCEKKKKTDKSNLRKHSFWLTVWRDTVRDRGEGTAVGVWTADCPSHTVRKHRDICCCLPFFFSISFWYTTPIQWSDAMRWYLPHWSGSLPLSLSLSLLPPPRKCRHRHTQKCIS